MQMHLCPNHWPITHLRSKHSMATHLHAGYTNSKKIQTRSVVLVTVGQHLTYPQHFFFSYEHLPDGGPVVLSLQLKCSWHWRTYTKQRYMPHWFKKKPTSLQLSPWNWCHKIWNFDLGTMSRCSRTAWRYPMKRVFHIHCHGPELHWQMHYACPAMARQEDTCKLQNLRDICKSQSTILKFDERLQKVPFCSSRCCLLIKKKLQLRSAGMVCSIAADKCCAEQF